MSTTISPTLSAASDLPGSEFEYRPLNTGAIAAMAFGVLSLVVVFAGRTSFESCLMLSPLPLIGIVLGWRAFRQIRANADRYSGAGLAIGGAALSALCLIAGLAVASYTYATEVRPGYTRTSFEEFRPDEADLRGDKLIPEDVLSLDGKKVFIKGYIRPDSTPYRQNIGKFLLVRDNNQCCFGDISTVQFFDQVEVTLTGNMRVDYSPSLYGIHGTLHVKPENAKRGLGAPVFAMEADSAQ